MIARVDTALVLDRHLGVIHSASCPLLVEGDPDKYEVFGLPEKSGGETIAKTAEFELGAEVPT